MVNINTRIRMGNSVVTRGQTMNNDCFIYPCFFLDPLVSSAGSSCSAMLSNRAFPPCPCPCPCPCRPRENRRWSPRLTRFLICGLGWFKSKSTSSNDTPRRGVCENESSLISKIIDISHKKMVRAKRCTVFFKVVKDSGHY